MNPVLRYVKFLAQEDGKTQFLYRFGLTNHGASVIQETRQYTSLEKCRCCGALLQKKEQVFYLARILFKGDDFDIVEHVRDGASMNEEEVEEELRNLLVKFGA